MAPNCFFSMTDSTLSWTDPPNPNPDARALTGRRLAMVVQCWCPDRGRELCKESITTACLPEFVPTEYRHINRFTWMFGRLWTLHRDLCLEGSHLPW